MTQRLPGTAPLDSLRAKGGRYLSVLLDGRATSDAEMDIAHYFASGTRMAADDFRLTEVPTPDAADRISGDGVTLSIYPDSSVLITRCDGRNEIMFPLGVEIDKWNLASAIEAAFSPVRIKAGYSRLSVSDLANASMADLQTMLFAAECSSIMQDIISDALRLFEARSSLGNLQVAPSDDRRLGFFPPLRGNPRSDSGIKRNLDALHAALKAEMQLLWEEVPFIRNEWPEMVVRGSLPCRDGTLQPPTAHLLTNENPMDWEVASLIQPVLDAYCASASLVPDRSAVCEYKHGRIGRGALTPDGPLPAIEPTNIMVIRPEENLTAHEAVEIVALRNELRAEHANQIQACAEALDIQWTHTPAAHAKPNHEESHA